MAVKTILVVDDVHAHLENLRNAVKDTGARIITATNGNEAIEKAKAEKPDLILMDIVMDGLDGYGACREITRSEETKHIPVIFVSSKNQRADKIWAEKQGAKTMIQKPYTNADIVEQIQRYC